MRNTFTLLLFGGPLMITTAVLPGNASPAPSDGSLKMSVLSGRPVVDGVYLNGKGPFQFLVDTGAQTNQLDASIARKIGLKPTFRAEIATVAGNGLVRGGRVTEVTLGRAAASDQEFLFTVLDGVHQLASSIQGVLGQEFLSHFDYLLDFADRRITFGAVEPEGGIRSSFVLTDGRPTIDTDKGKLVLDSGTEIAILYAAPVGRLQRCVVTASDGSGASETRSLKVRVGEHAYSTMAASVPRGSLQEDGVLPAGLFHSVYVSNSRKFLLLDPTARSGR